MSQVDGDGGSSDSSDCNSKSYLARRGGDTLSASHDGGVERDSNGLSAAGVNDAAENGGGSSVMVSPPAKKARKVSPHKYIYERSAGKWTVEFSKGTSKDRLARARLVTKAVRQLLALSTRSPQCMPGS